MIKNEQPRRGRFIFWTYVMPITIFTLFYVLQMSVELGNNSENYHLSSESSWLSIFYQHSFAIALLILCLCAIATFFYTIEKDNWVSWSIGVAAVLFLLCIIPTIQVIIAGHPFFSYRSLLAMTAINLTYLGFLIKLKRKTNPSTPHETARHRTP